ncbi:proteoglycan Cow-like [Pollicipes pollicipes]|uniref:proteoglycan Cow-like n=1 Tax=Pollicipes pollicipes TaxID=41117 RepID=UPI001884B4AE|nr:proteoglycan Cow-like [Pollicipes pollicipes]
MRLLAVALAVALCSVALANKQKKSYDGDFLFEEDDWKQKKEKPAVKTWIWDPENGLCSALECRSSEMCLLEDSFTAVCVSRSELKTNGDRIISRQLAEDEHLIKSEPFTSEGEDDIDDDEDEDDEIDLDEDEDEDEDEYEYDEDEDEYDDEKDEDDDEDADVAREVQKVKECRECPYTHPTVSTYICGTDNRTYSSLCRLEQHNCIHDSLVTTDCKGFCPCRVPGSYWRRKQKQRDRLARPEFSSHQKKLAKTRLKKKYDKYKQDQKSYNNVKYYPKNTGKSYKHQTSAECSKEDLDSMGSRLVDWFVVLKATSGGAKPKRKHHKYYSTHFPSDCKKMAQWMFLHLDTDADTQLTQRELFAVERDQHERCLKPFLDRCDLNVDIFLTTREWCRCFETVDTPCKSRTADDGVRPGAYLPSCDSDGFYRPTQCHGSQCWCADRYGVELKGTRGRRGTTRCDGDNARYDADFNVADEDDEDNYVIDGSGDGLQEF